MNAIQTWWNTPTDNLHTKGQNILTLLFIFPPIVAILMALIKVTLPAEWSWKVVAMPLAFTIVALILTPFTKTGRSMMLKGQQMNEISATDPLALHALEATHTELQRQGLTFRDTLHVFTDANNENILYVLSEEAGGLNNTSLYCEIEKSNFKIVELKLNETTK